MHAVPAQVRRGRQIAGTGIRACDLPYVCWSPNPGLHMALTLELSASASLAATRLALGILTLPPTSDEVMSHLPGPTLQLF